MRKIVDSGVDWIGFIPAGWTIRKCKYLFDILKRIAGREGIDVLSVTQRGLRIKDIESGNGQLADDYSGYQLVYPGDFVMNHMDLLTGWIDCSKLFGVTSPDYRVFRPKKNIPTDNGFYKYLFQYCYSNKVFYNLGNGVADKGRWRLQASAFKNFSVPLPPYEEQRHIANHLDEHCGVIDEAKKIIVSEIESLHRLRKATICKAVTKGLNSKVSMRDSGIRWIGHVPSSWVCAHLKYAVNLGHGSDREHKDGPAVLLGRKGSLNNPQFIQGDYWNVDTAFDAKAKSTMLLRYFYYVASSIDVGELSTNTAKPSMTQADWYGITIPYPPLVEQKKIVDYLDERCAAIDSVIDTRTKQLERLEDYRKALIYAYVTGKKEVPAS